MMPALTDFPTVPPLPYSIVIATFDRPAELRVTLDSIAAQTHKPDRVVIVDSSTDERSREVADAFTAVLPLHYERAIRPSAAVQRNQGARTVETPLIAFIDDDVFIPPESLEKICAAFEADEKERRIGGIAARIVDMRHPAPKKLLWCYYRIQAGYSHPTYGGKLFGPAINCLPTYTEEGGDLIRSDWLSSTCVFYRTELFQREKFPEFEGYSFLEDVHLSARIGRTHELYFHRNADFEHRDAASSFKRNRRELAKMRVRYQRIVAREIIGLHEPLLTLKLLLHRLFATVYVVRRRQLSWLQEVLGIWT
jgi:glycosyltransferase involved in cell wall biosynthesis